MEDVKSKVKIHFESRFQEYVYRRPSLAASFIHSLNDGRVMHKGPFYLEDLKAVIWDGDRDKILGPGGFNMCFYRSCWDIFKDDILK